MTDRWYAVHCKPREEHKADAMLRAKGYLTYFPHFSEWVEASKRRARLEHRAYLSRYLFVCFRSERAHLESAYDVNETPGVGGMVYSGVDRNGDRAVFPIPLDVMDELRALADAYGQIHARKKRKNGFSAAVGDMVRFTDRNPLEGLLATIEAVLDDGKSIRVRLERQILGQKSMRMVISQRQLVEVIKA
jgi:transcription antitermination factor NusG